MSSGKNDRVSTAPSNRPSLPEPGSAGTVSKRLYSSLRETRMQAMDGSARSMVFWMRFCKAATSAGAAGPHSGRRSAGKERLSADLSRQGAACATPNTAKHPTVVPPSRGRFHSSRKKSRRGVPVPSIPAGAGEPRASERALLRKASAPCVRTPGIIHDHPSSPIGTASAPAGR